MEIKLLVHDSLLHKPTESGDYLVCMDGEWVTAHYSAKYNLFNAYDEWDPEYAQNWGVKVDFWSKLPEL